MTDLKEEIPAQWFLTQEETLTQEEFFTQFIQKETLTQEPGGVFFSPRRILSHRRKSSTGDKSASKPEGGEGLVKGEVGLGPPGKNPAL